MKKLLLVLFALLLFVAPCFSSDSYSLKIKNADSVRVKGDFIMLSGNIDIDFKTDSGDQYRLTAQQVSIDTESKILDASGSVVLKKSNDSQEFKGESVSLDWEKLDIKVLDGKSRSERKNASQTKVNFYSQGQSISYAGEGDSVLFDNGIVSTKSERTNWSINAKKIELLGNDLFFRNATLRIGRVPIFWFPVFFYPGTRLGFNPAIGVTDSGVSFINTTTEIYGTYDMNVSSTSVQEYDTDAVAGNVLSLLKKDDNTVLIRDGLLYKEFKESDPLPKIESWARKNNNYFVFTADAYSDRGLSAGYDTRNRFKEGKITLNSKGISAYDVRDKYKENRFRFAADTDFSFRHNSTNLSLKIPMYSDPDVKKDYYNRINTFSLDSIFGTEQRIPTSFNSTASTYTISLNASSSKSFKNFNFNLSSLNAKINYVYNKDKNKYKITSMSLPTMYITSNGTVFDKSTQSSSKTVFKDYKNSLAKSFAKDLEDLGNAEEGTEERIADLITAPEVELSKTSQISGGQAKLTYNLNYSFDNYYSETFAEDFSKKTLSSKLSGSIAFYAKSPGSYIEFRDTLTPSYNFAINTEDTKTRTSNVTNSLSLSVPNLGLSYSLNQKVYSNTVTTYENGTKTESPFYGKFDASSITGNSLSFRKSLGIMSVGFSSVFKPLTESFSPSFSLSKSGVSINGDYSVRRPLNQEKFDKDRANLNISYSNKNLSTTMYNTYDFNKDGWAGYSTTARAQYNIQKPSASVYSTIKMTDEFKPTSMESGLNFKGNTAVMTFKDEKLEKDKLRVNLKYSLPAKYFWKNRIGFESSMSSSFNYDFSNEYAAAFNFNFTLGLSINKFLDLSLSLASVNNSFYNYYEDGKFVFSLMTEDLFKSFDFIGGGNRHTNFNMNSLHLSLVHYMEDWNLYIDATGEVVNEGSNIYYFDPEIRVYIKWNIIPEIKIEDTYAYNYLGDGEGFYRWEKW